MNKQLAFEDLSECWRYAMRDSSAYQKASRDNHDVKWTGGLNWPEARAMALSGWREGLEDIDRYRAQIAPIITEKVLRPQQVFSMDQAALRPPIEELQRLIQSKTGCFFVHAGIGRNLP